MYTSRNKQTLLLPVRAWFIWLSLALALLLAMLPLGRLVWMPDIMAVVLMFWAVHQPGRMGMAGAFALGLVMDIHQGSILGQHALAYALLAFLAAVLSRRILWYGVIQQALHVFPLFLAAHLVMLAAGVVATGLFPGWDVMLAPVAEAVLWPMVSWVLLAPQRRAPDQDDNRPL
ncbi:rod shape-determining protein MreD [Comamonadaceae bacterium PP-2]